MKLLQFILAILATICAIVMLYGSIVTYSPMRTFSVSIMGTIFIGCIVFVVLSYKELKC